MDAKEANFLHWYTHLSLERLWAARARRKYTFRIMMFASIFLGILFGYGLRVFSEHVGFAIISAAALFVVFIWPGLLIRFLNGLDAQAESELAKAHEKRLKDLGFEDLVKRYGL